MIYETDEKLICVSETTPIYQGNKTFSQEICRNIEIPEKNNVKDELYKYKARGDMFVPVPNEEKYFDIADNCTKKIRDEMVIGPHCELIIVLKILTNFPFLLVDLMSNTEFRIYNKDDHSGDVENLLGSKESDEKLSIDELLNTYPEAGQRFIQNYEFRYGIITLSEINKRIIKESLYSIIAAFEKEISNIIEEEYPNSENLLSAIDSRAVQSWKESSETEAEVHIAEFINLSDMRNLITDSKHLTKKSGFKNNRAMIDKEYTNPLHRLRECNPERVFNEIKELRNKVMHANHALVHDRGDLHDIVFQVDLLMALLTEISDEYELTRG